MRNPAKASLLIIFICRNLMQKEQIRATLKLKLFGGKGLRIRGSVDIEDNESQTQTLRSQESFQDSYAILEKIGEGANSVVFKCRKLPKNNQQKPGQLFAVKQYRTHEPETVGTIIRTFNIQRSLGDIPGVCRVYDLFITSNYHHEVIEYHELKSLEAFIGRILPQEAREVMRQLSLAMGQIHARGVAHRDLKPENILVQLDPLTVKVIDFGVSKRFKVRDTQTDMWTRTGTLFYQAPEVFMGGGYDEGVDVWALGVILFQMLCQGTLPFYAETVSDTIEQIVAEEPNCFDFEEFKQLGALERDLLRRLLKTKPEQRLSAEEITLHPWFNWPVGSVVADDSWQQQDWTPIERTQSTQQMNYSSEKFASLIESYEWGDRIHVQKK